LKATGTGIMKKMNPPDQFLSRFMCSVFILLAGVLNSQINTITYVYTGSIQQFTVPLQCTPMITIEAIGAGGGSVTNVCTANGGLGSSMKGVFCGKPGDIFSILVGQAGQSNGADGGGGGGSFVVAQGNIPLVVAGGGGGATNNVWSCGSNLNGLDASITTSGTAGANGLGFGGTAGNGGTCSASGGGAGGGFYTNGVNGSSGMSFLNGAAGGVNAGDDGGYGGGGAGWWTGGNGGGGGGYSGGGASGTQPYSGGGGGGSYNSGMNQVNTPGVRAGNGLVIVTYSLGTTVPTAINQSVICAGGTNTLYAGGMVSYTWSNGANTSIITVSPPVTTNYTVFATNQQGCVTMAVITVSVNPYPPLSAVCNPSVLCPGNTATLTASGATSFTWSTGTVSNSITANPTVTTFYSVSGTSNLGCVQTSTLAVKLDSLSLTVTPDTFVCMGKTITLNAGGASNYTWNPGSSAPSPFPILPVSPSNDTSYVVHGTDVNGCLLADTVFVKVKPVPPVQISPVTNVVCRGDQVKLFATGALEYNWSNGGTGPSIEIIPALNVTYEYTVSGRDSNGCVSVAHIFINVSACTGIESEDENLHPVTIFPNPTEGLFEINFPEDLTGTLKIVNASGVELQELKVASGAKIDLRREKPGIYMLYFKAANGTVYPSRLIRK
jgi:hypothetical protein